MGVAHRIHHPVNGEQVMASREKPDKKDKEAVIEYADELYEKGQWKELLDYLQEVLGADGDDPELTWRLLRVAFRLGEQTFKSGDAKEAERVVDLAAARGKRALEKEDRNFGLHKVSAFTTPREHSRVLRVQTPPPHTITQWSGILYRQIGDIKGMKVKIENSYKIKEHFQVSQM